MEKSIESQTTIITVKWLDRWQVYHRLKDLDIECSCRSNQPLKVNPHNPHAAIQIWSVVKQCTANRQELIDWLDRCWNIESHR